MTDDSLPISHNLENSRYFIWLIIENDHKADVIVKTSISGTLQSDYLKPAEIVIKRKDWKTKKSLSISAVEASTNRKLYINGKSVIHVESTKVVRLKVLNVQSKE